MGSFAMEGDVGGAVARDDATVCKATNPRTNKKLTHHLMIIVDPVIK